ncbi:MAG: hypothetical protein H7289_08805 [Mucilaginibacter sp.]|nr:hypothetical protein [Mucilaginibacter sp.]
MKKCKPILLLLLISLILYSCCCHVGPTPLIIEGATGTENRVDWKPVMNDTIKNDSITIWAKTDYDVIKVKFALSDVAKIDYSPYKKPYLLDYYLVAPTIAVYKLDPTADNQLSISYFDEASTHIKWLKVSFSFVFKNITPAPNSFFGPSNLSGSFNIKVL